MMPYIVKANFRDKFTKKLYKKGDSYTHEDEKRIAFLIEKGFLEQPECPPEKTGESDNEEPKEPEKPKKKAKK